MIPENKRVLILAGSFSNLGSLVNMIEKIGAQTITCSTSEKSFDRLVICGVGSFSSGIGEFSQTPNKELILSCVKRGIPILGICLGAQILGISSEEDDGKGFGLVPIKTLWLKGKVHTKVPNVGWQTIKILNSSDQLLRGVRGNARYYFSHSYAMFTDQKEITVAEIDEIPYSNAIYHRNNIYGIQFHPEKSQNDGFKILENFVNLEF